MSDLRRLIAEAQVLAGGSHPCHVLGHNWEFHGGSACMCEDGVCSIPVYHCAACGDYDYGDNDEAVAIRDECERRNPDV